MAPTNDGVFSESFVLWASPVLFWILSPSIKQRLRERSPPTEHSNIQAALPLLTWSIEGTSTDVAKLNDEINDLLGQRKQHWTLIRESRSRLAIIEQLDMRFALLKEHYESDLERLTFLGESDHFLAQLGQGHCPICGQLLEEHTAEQIANESDKQTSIQEASSVEKAKIRKLIEELEATLQALSSEASNLDARKEDAISSIKDLGRRVQENLEPDAVVAKEELGMLVAKRIEIEQRLERRNRLTYLRTQQEELGKKPTKKQIEKDTDIAPSAAVTKERRSFCDALEKRLRTWRFPKVGTVEFEKQKNAFDIVVNGQNRTSRGKGVRALLHSAFTIALIYHAFDRHSKLVVLDSPLTSFKDKDRVNVEDDVQLALYEDLVQTPDDVQIILLENKEPPEQLHDQMNYVHFSGNELVGRYGFYPSSENE